MTTRYWAFNSLAGSRRTATAVVDGDTTAGRFDSSFVANAIKVLTGSDYLQILGPFLNAGTSITGLLSCRLDVYHTAAPASGNTLALWLNAGANAYRLQLTGGSTVQMQYWNSGTSAWVNWGSTFTINSTTLYTLVVNLTINSAFEVLQGGASVASSAVVPTNGASAVTELRLFCAGNSGTAHYSQLMGADYDLRDAHLFPVLPTANGTYTDGTGAATDVGEAVLDDGTAIGLPAVGNKHTFTKPAIPTVPVGLVIAGMVLNIRGRVGGGVVTDGKAKIRSGTTDSASTGRSFNGGYEPRAAIFTTDPNTGTAWTKTGFDAAEVGVEAA